MSPEKIPKSNWWCMEHPSARVNRLNMYVEKRSLNREAWDRVRDKWIYKIKSQQKQLWNPSDCRWPCIHQLPLFFLFRYTKNKLPWVCETSVCRNKSYNYLRRQLALMSLPTVWGFWQKGKSSIFILSLFFEQWFQTRDRIHVGKPIMIIYVNNEHRICDWQGGTRLTCLRDTQVYGSFTSAYSKIAIKVCF